MDANPLELKTLNLKEISNEIDTAFYEKSKIDPHFDIDFILDDKYNECKAILTDKLEDYLAILDNGIILVTKIHELCKQNHLETKSGFSFVVLTAKMVSLLIGIRKMVYSGIADCVKNLNRPLIETIDLFFACLANKELSDNFAKTDEMYDNNKFYRERFSNGKLRKECNLLFRKLLIDEDYINHVNEKRKIQHSFLSNSIHSSFNSSFSNYMMPTLDLDFNNNVYGKVTSAFPMMLIKIIEDICILNQVFYMTLEKKIAEDLKQINLNDIDPLYLHYNSKFEFLCDNTWRHLYDQANAYPEFLNSVLDEM